MTSVYFVELLPPFPMAEHFQGQVLLRLNRNDNGEVFMTCTSRLVEFTKVEDYELHPDEVRKKQSVIDKVSGGAMAEEIRT